MFEQQCLFELPNPAKKTKPNNPKPKPSSSTLFQQHTLFSNMVNESDEIPKEVQSPLVTVHDEDLDAFLSDISIDEEWVSEEIDSLRLFILKESLQQLLYAKSSNAVRDDIWMWLRQDNFDEPFSYFTCALTAEVNPILFRESVFLTLNKNCKVLSQARNKSKAELKLYNWLKDHIIHQAREELNYAEEVSYRLSFIFPTSL